MTDNIASKHLSQPWFDLVRSGRKTHEGRLNTGFWERLKVGNLFKFHNEREEFTVVVAEISEYETFEEAINDIGLEHVLPTCFDAGLTVKQAVNAVYREYYSLEDERKYQVKMFKFIVVAII